MRDELLINYTNSVIRFDKFTRLFLCYDRLQLELSEVKGGVQFVSNKRRLIKTKKSAITERNEAEEYLQLPKQYVCLTSIIYQFI